MKSIKASKFISPSLLRSLPREQVLDTLMMRADKSDDPAQRAEIYTACIEELAVLPGDLALIHNNRGAAYAEMRLLEEAVADYTAAMEYDPSMSRAHGNRGLARAEMGDLENALDDCNTALMLTPNDPLAYGDRASVMSMMERHSEAIADCTAGINLAPDFAPLFNSRGLYYSEIGDHTSALTDCRKATELEPDNYDFIINKGYMHFRLEEYERAAKSFTRAIKIQPEWETAYLHRGLSCVELRLFDRAIADYEYAARLRPDCVDAYLNKGWLLATCDDLTVRNGEEAIRAASVAVDLTREQDPGCMDAMAAALAQASYFDEAVDMELRAIALAADMGIHTSEYERCLALYRAGHAYVGPYEFEKMPLQ